MKQFIYTLALILPFALSANIGSCAYSYTINKVNIDGNSAEWKNHEAIQIFDPMPGIKSTFKTAFNADEGSLYFFVTVEDDDYQFDATKEWHQNDNIAIYLDPIHSERASTCVMMILNEDGAIFKQADDAHQLLSKDNTSVVVKTDGSRRYYEGKIQLKKYVKVNRSIGFDIMAIDVDAGESNKYLHWAPGGLKEYRSGQLGDLMLLDEQSKTYGTFSGTLGWKNEIDEPLPNTVRIKSLKSPEFWISIPVDSTGAFAGELPIGTYKLLPSTKITSPGEDYGFDNQFRIDDSYSQEFEILANQKTKTEPYLIPTYAFPNYLMRKQGILHNYVEELKPEVDNFIQTACAYYNIPGASVALIKDKEIVYYNRFGVENALTQVPLGEKTVFQAASVTKAVFAFMVLRLVEKNVLELDKPLYNYLPFENIDHDPGYKKMTARHVLSHQTGLPNWAFGGPGNYASGQKTDLKFEPGTDYGYSGEGFEYLGRVIEKLTGKDLNQLLREEVIDALSIPPLYFSDDGSLHQARGHYPNGTPTYFGTPGTPGVAHSMLTEAWSFAHFMQALSRKEGLPNSVYEALTQPIIKAGGFDSPENLYSNLSLSLGFFVRDTPFGKAIGHGGNNGDFQADFLLYTEKDMGYVVFVNDNTGHKLAHQLNKYLIYGQDR